MATIFLAPLSAGGLGKSSGSELAPEAVIRALSERLLTESGEKVKAEKKLLKTDSSNLESAHEEVFKAVKSYSFESPLFLLGGDHSITYPSFRAVSEKFSGSGIVVFDAHPDLQENFKPPSHEDYLRVLMEENAVSADRIVLAGVRSFSAQERSFMESQRRRGLTVMDMKAISSEGIWEACDAIMEKARTWSRVYISIDIDVVDPAFAPGVAYREPAGLTSRQLIMMLHRLLKLPNIAAFDIVEVIPDRDVAQLTVSLAAKVLQEILTYKSPIMRNP